MGEIRCLPRPPSRWQVKSEEFSGDLLVDHMQRLWLGENIVHGGAEEEQVDLRIVRRRFFPQVR